MMITLMLFVIGFVVFSVQCCSENLFDGYRLDGFTTEKLPNIGVHACIKDCLLRKHCQSINYNKKQFSCEINTESAEISVEGALHTDYIFANVVNSSEVTLGKCMDPICPSLFKCVNTHDSATCLSTDCVAGTYGKDGQCVPCPVGQYSTGSGMQWCLMCQPGTYQDQLGSGYCQPCPTGTFQTKQGQTTCTSCPIGHYNNQTGMQFCVVCPKGTFQDQPGSSDCKSCGSGTYQPDEGETTCLSCPVGRYSAESGSWQCLECPPGTYQDATGSSHCKLCPAGTYQLNYEEETADSCKFCEPGNYQPKEGQSKCTECSPGFYQPSDGQKSCVFCPGAQFQDEFGQTSCKDCSQFNKCYNLNKTMCFNLHKNDRAFGYSQSYQGELSHNECKQSCWRDVNCRGFSYMRHSNPGYCYTHPSRDSYDYPDYNFFTFPRGCHF